MKFSKYEDVKWLYGQDLDIHIGVDDALPANSAADIVYARLDPGQTLKLHSHTREKDGYEAFFFFQGAHIRLLLLDNAMSEICRDTPFHLTFHGDEAHGVTNLAERPLIFEVICAPRHKPGEEVIIE